MELLVRKHIRWFYVALIIGILFQLVNVIIVSITPVVTIGWRLFLVIFLSILNLILLISDLRHSLKQQFTESKNEAKVLSITMIPLLLFQLWVCSKKCFSTLVLGDYLMSMVTIEIMLNLKIKSIEYLERLAKDYKKGENYNAKH